MGLTKFKRSVAVLQSELSWHAIIVSWQVYYIESELWRHVTWKNQKIARSPHILGRLDTCANSVYQVLLPFSRAPGTRLTHKVYKLRLSTRPSHGEQEEESLVNLHTLVDICTKPQTWAPTMFLLNEKWGQTQKPVETLVYILVIVYRCVICWLSWPW